MTVKHHGSGTFIDDKSVASKRGYTVYAWAEFPSLERVVGGLFITDGGADGEWIESRTLEETGMEPLAQVSEFRDAIKEAGSKYAFEEYPFVEVSSKEEFDEAIEASDFEDVPAWEGPGVYDFRDFTKSYDSVEDHQMEAMTSEADNMLNDYMFQSDDWKEAVVELFGEVDIKFKMREIERKRPPGLFTE
jgi:hypothetical protein